MTVATPSRFRRFFNRSATAADSGDDVQTPSTSSSRKTSPSSIFSHGGSQYIRQGSKDDYSRLRAFFRFSAPVPAAVAVRLTALVGATAADEVTACGGVTFESAGPSGAGELCRSLF